MKYTTKKVRSHLGRLKRNFLRRNDARWGQDFISEIKQRLNKDIEIIFDVGAHIGVTAIEFSDRFPRASVYAFEPSSINLKQLKDNLIGKPDIDCFQLAFGERAGEALLSMDVEHPSMARISEDGNLGSTEIVEVQTVDTFCKNHAIDRIDILKVDTEGFEIQVLRGAADMLARSAIAVIKLECTLNPDCEYHTKLFDICSILEPFGYRVFGMYDQWEDVFTFTSSLRRFDVVFISESCNRLKGQKIS
jgi:FkbM family methyltransferase